ncbi:MAG TPA: hypothetical protein VM182_09030, partial [Terriglobia bacterium]|nr:hypothetical protein [Terriglobia bacterium]
SLRTALAGGLGSNQGYFASSLTAEKDWMTLKASYVRAEDRFRRIIVETPLSSETDRENILLTLRPKPFVSFAVGRQNLLLPPGRGGGSLRATVNQFRGAADAAGFTFSGSFFDSRFQGRRNTGNSFSVGREIAGRMDVRASVFMSRPAQGPRSTTWLASLRELISPRLSLLQLITQSNGQTTVSFGGSLLTNRVSIGVEYQTLYIPFQSANQFKQVLVLNVRLHPFGNVQLNAGTYVAPDGAVKYTAYGSTFVYRGAMVGGSPASFSLPKYSVRGRVIDEDGHPVRGAALRLDGEVAYTDSRGHFFVRKRKAGPFRLQVLVNEFVVPGRYEVISAPTEVQAAPENRVADITIVLRRTAVRSIQALQDHSPDALDQ